MNQLQGHQEASQHRYRQVGETRDVIPADQPLLDEFFVPWDSIHEGNPRAILARKEKVRLVPYLIMQGYLQRTPRGRIATLAAWRHLGLTPPARSAAGGDLFEA